MLANWLSISLSSSYPKPKVLTTHGSRPPSVSFSFFSIGTIPRGGLMFGMPSVKSSRCWKRLPSLPAFRSSKPVLKPSHRFVMPFGVSWLRLSSVVTFPFPVMGVSGETVVAAFEYDTTAMRSRSPRFPIRVLSACLTMSSMDSPWLISPLSSLRIASEFMEPDVSTTQQMSDGVRCVPSGGSSMTMMGVPASAPSGFLPA
mmetsp:Transcript_115463/g.327168  ORF Transcript_115463/g.327168 Transcript_115463/m.327168 type:complete len:201 (+) Transcript_115463:631-1233(+)